MIVTENKREHYPFTAYHDFDHNIDYFGFGKMETYFFSQKKFAINYCSLFIAHYWRENVVTIHESLKSVFYCIVCMKEFVNVFVRVETRVCEL